MNIVDLSIKRPVFIVSCFLLTIIVGLFSLQRLSVDLFPNIAMPVVVITTTYSGTNPNEMETLISKPIEESLSTVSGIDSIRSISKDSVSTVIAQFTLDTDIKYAEQQVRDRIAYVRSQLPEDIDTEPKIRRVDPNDNPILGISVSADMKPSELYDLVDRQIKPLIEQIPNVGLVEIFGGRKREIQVLLDKNKLLQSEISASDVVRKLHGSGKNVAAGHTQTSESDSSIRTIGEFDSVADISNFPIKFYQNDRVVRVKDVGIVSDTLEDELTQSFANGIPALTINVYKQTDSNTVKAADAVMQLIKAKNDELKTRYKSFNMRVITDGSKSIRDNIYDVTESIIIGTVLTILAVFVFLGNWRSTIITAIAIPNSLLSAFILMHYAGFSVNIMTLLAMSLSVGLLIDDAIVVRENIFRHIELGQSPRIAASIATKEIALAVIATTFTVIAVFGPIAFLKGVVGQFFKEFGLTVCFIMLVSLLDALTMAPMLSAYFAKSNHNVGSKNTKFSNIFNRIKLFSGAINDKLISGYERVILFAIKRYLFVIIGTVVIFFSSFIAIKSVPKTFIKDADTGEFSVSLELKPGSPLEMTSKIAKEVDEKIRKNPEVEISLLTVGSGSSDGNKARMYVDLIPYEKRNGVTTSVFKDKIRKMIKDDYPDLYNFSVSDANGSAGSGGTGVTKPFNINIVSASFDDSKSVATQLIQKLKDHPDLKDVDMNYRTGKPEIRIITNKRSVDTFGASALEIGNDLRTQVEGTAAAIFRDNDIEYNIKVRIDGLRDNFESNISQIYVPNMNGRLVKLKDVSEIETFESKSAIYRQDRGRYVQVSASLNPNGPGGLNKAIEDAKKYLANGEIVVPNGVRYEFIGQAKNFKELNQSMATALLLAVLFIYLILASLYNSFTTPFLIMIVLPLAACGSFYALAITNSAFDLFSMIGCIMLLGISAKNSILLVDCIKKAKLDGHATREAIMIAGKLRIRPIVMTSVVLIAGMLPVAIGLNEASAQRTGMGIVMIGGLISSTTLTLVVLPAIYILIDKIGTFFNSIKNRIFKSS